MLVHEKNRELLQFLCASSGAYLSHTQKSAIVREVIECATNPESPLRDSSLIPSALSKFIYDIVNNQNSLDQKWYDDALELLSNTYAPFKDLSKDDKHSCAVEIILIVASSFAIQLFYRVQKLPIPDLPNSSEDAENFKRVFVSDFADELEYNNRSHLPQIKTLNSEKKLNFELFTDPRYQGIFIFFNNLSP